MAALIAGGGMQSLLVSYEQFWLRQPLDTISPLLTEHGVLVRPDIERPILLRRSHWSRDRQKTFASRRSFLRVAEKVFDRDLPEVDKKGASYHKIIMQIEEKVAGDRTHPQPRHRARERRRLCRGKGAEMGAVRGEAEGHAFLLVHSHGSHIVYRLTQADMLACVKMVRGDSSQIWLCRADARTERKTKR